MSTPNFKFNAKKVAYKLSVQINYLAFFERFTVGFTYYYLLLKIDFFSQLYISDFYKLGKDKH